MQRKRRTEQLSLENGRDMELQLIKHDEALKELKEFQSASKCASKYLLQAIPRAILQSYGQVVNATNIRST